MQGAVYLSRAYHQVPEVAMHRASLANFLSRWYAHQNYLIRTVTTPNFQMHKTLGGLHPWALIALPLCVFANQPPTIAQGGCSRQPLYNQYAMIGQQECCLKYGLTGVIGKRCASVYYTGTVVEADCDDATMLSAASCRYYVNGAHRATCSYYRPSLFSTGGTKCY